MTAATAAHDPAVRGGWTKRRAVAVAAGGAGGATLRWLVVTLTTTGRFPWPVLAVNVAGSFLLGLLLAEEWSHPAARIALHDAGAIGFCGGLTTFSTFAVEVVDLARDGEVLPAVTYAAASVVGTLAAVAAGAAALGRIRALLLPVEEEP